MDLRGKSRIIFTPKNTYGQ